MLVTSKFSLLRKVNSRDANHKKPVRNQTSLMYRKNNSGSPIFSLLVLVFKALIETSLGLSSWKFLRHLETIPLIPLG